MKVEQLRNLFGKPIILSICLMLMLCWLCVQMLGQSQPPVSQIGSNTMRLSSTNMDKGINDMRVIYSYILDYRTANNGVQPASMSDLVKHISKHSKDRDDFVRKVQALTNPDAKEADNENLRKKYEHIIPYVVTNSRPDGMLIGFPKPLNSRDVLATTDLYVHNREHQSKGGKRYVDARGSYLILWDDGNVSRVPFDQIVYVIDSDKAYTAYYRQAGIPSADSLTYSEFWSKDYPETSLPLGKPLPKVKDEPIPDNGGPESLIQLSRLMNSPDFYGFEREKMWALLDPAQPEFSLAEMQTAASKLELATQVKKASLGELANFGAPAILFLSDDKRQVALAALSDKYAMVIDRGVTRVVARDLLAQRYSGEALIPQVALDKPAALRAENGLQQITVNDIKQEIPVQATLKNSGATPLELQIEQPIPGCLKAKLSAETIAPGAQVTLNATIKWREVMKTTAQNVVIWVKSNDPARPRLPIAIRLALPKAPTTP